MPPPARFVPNPPVLKSPKPLSQPVRIEVRPMVQRMPVRHGVAHTPAATSNHTTVKTISPPRPMLPGTHSGRNTWATRTIQPAAGGAWGAGPSAAVLAPLTPAQQAANAAAIAAARAAAAAAVQTRAANALITRIDNLIAAGGGTPDTNHHRINFYPAFRETRAVLTEAATIWGARGGGLNYHALNAHMTDAAPYMNFLRAESAGSATNINVHVYVRT